MSVYSFTNAIIGFARQVKKEERRRTRRRQNPTTVEPGLEVAMKLYDSGYFTEKESVAFGDALSKLIKTSDPTRKRKVNDQT